jgi:hypothetical protein
LVPLIITVALGTGLPFASVTLPVTTRVCAIAAAAKKSRALNKDTSFLIEIINFGYEIVVTAQI